MMGAGNGTPMRVMLSGASGMLGLAIDKALHNKGIDTLKLVRREPREESEVQWNPTPSGGGTREAGGGIGSATEIKRLEGLAAAVHLSGANVSSRRWTKAYKEEMWASRVGTTRTLCTVLAGLREPPKVLVCASAVGLYGERGDEVLDEDSAAGTGYFPELCAAWEAATRPAEEAGIRVVHLRFGVVIGRDGGAMGRLAPMFKLGIGGRLGSGRQWMSWVSEADAVGAALFALEHEELAGGVNAVAPEPVTNAEFTRELGRAVHRPAVMPAPAFALRLVFGEMADEALLASTRVVPKRLLGAGYVFQHGTIGEAFRAALS